MKTGGVKMLNWYEMPGALDFDNNPAFAEKMELDNREDDSVTVPSKGRNMRTTSSYVEKRLNKKKLVRRFLSMNPAMDFSINKGTDCINADVLTNPEYKEDGFYDPWKNYNFNTYCNIFISRRGDLRVYHGTAKRYRSGIYIIETRDRESQKVTNRRIRHLLIDVDDSVSANSYAYFKKAMSSVCYLR